jgi:signal transduction histidine kinase
MTSAWRWWSWLRACLADRRRLLVDGLFALGVTVLALVLTATGPAKFQPASWGVAIFWSVASAAPIALRRVAPWAAVVLAMASLTGPVFVRAESPALAFAYIVVTYSVSAHFRVRPAVLAAALIWVPVLALTPLAPPELNPSGLSTGYRLLTNTLVASVCFLVGRVVFTRRAYTAALEERAEAAESNQRSLAEQAVADERRRIARELHDVVAHHVSVTGVLATGARRMLHRDPAAADEALATIEDTSRTALREMRRLLTVLRTEAEPAVDLAPQPGLAGIDALVEQIREAGLPVALQVEGAGGPLDSGVALTVYRIVQEALTNAIKHAGEATAEVRLSFGTQWLVVEVFDTGRGPAPRGLSVGHGLVGMRERVALYGGTLRTGPRPGGGFRVYARIPIDGLGSPSGSSRQPGAPAKVPARPPDGQVKVSSKVPESAPRASSIVAGDTSPKATPSGRTLPNA